MPQRVQTPISGISTTSTYEDGATYSLVNLRPKNGALHPVPPRKVLQELSREYDIIFIHQNNDYQNWIGVVNEGDSSSVYWDIKNDPKLIAADILGPINSVQQVGNTLSLITSDNVFYLLYQDDNYRHLGTMPDLPILNMKTSDVMFHKQLFFKDEYGDRTITPTTLLDATKGLVNKAMNTLMEEQGLMLFDACFIRYAFRLYDGTLTKHSPPILAVPVRPILGGTEDMGHSSTYDANRSIKGIKYNFAGGVLHEEDRIDVLGYRIEINYDTSQLWDGTSWNDYSKWKDMIQSVDIFMSPPIGISNIEDIRKDLPTTEGVINYLNLIKKTPQEITKLVTNSSSFYLIESIPLGEKTPFEKPKAFPSADSSISKMENLIHQEAMKDDSFSNHIIIDCISQDSKPLSLEVLVQVSFNGEAPITTQRLRWGALSHTLQKWRSIQVPLLKKHIPHTQQMRQLQFYSPAHFFPIPIQEQEK